MIQPILVQDRKDHYEIIAGARRWCAAKMAGLKEVPVIIRDYTEQEIMEISLIENIQRENLSFIDEAKAINEFIKKYRITQVQAAEVLGTIRRKIGKQKILTLSIVKACLLCLSCGTA